MPAGFQSLPVPGNLSVKVFIEGEATPRFTNDNIDISTDEISIEFIAPEGEHIFIVIFEYIDLEFPRNDGNPWELARWTSDPVTVSDSEPLSLQVDKYEHQDFDGDEVSNADELTARTNPGNPDDVPFAVTATAGTGGSISPASRFVSLGSTATFTVTPAAGQSASMDGTCGGTLNGNTYTTDAVTQACTVIASFSLIGYSVTATADPNGSIDPLSRTVNHGSTTTFAVIPATGYGASMGGSCGGTLSANTFTTDTITQDCTVSVTFSLNSYTVSTNAGTGGFINPTSLVVNHGSTATFTVFLTQGFSFDDVSVTGCDGRLVGNVYTTGAITEDCTVSATFTLNEYSVTATTGEGGSISPLSRVVTHGSTATFTVTPDTGYSIDLVTGCNGTLLGNTYTTGPVTAACSVSATFIVNEYTITATAGEGGSISPLSEIVDHGSTTTFSVTPNTGYSASVDGTCGGTLVGNTYTTNAITADCTVNATFSLNSHTVTATAGTNGTINPSSRTVNHGSTTTFTLTPNTGYSAIVGGTCGGTLNDTTYTTNVITGSCTVTATFTQIRHTVTATSSGPSGTGISPSSRTVNHGSTTTFNINQRIGFIVTMGGTCGGTRNGNTYTTNAITANCTVTATFRRNN